MPDHCEVHGRGPRTSMMFSFLFPRAHQNHQPRHEKNNIPQPRGEQRIQRAALAHRLRSFHRAEIEKADHQTRGYAGGDFAALLSRRS